MTWGLRLWDAAGNLIFDTDHRLSREIGEITVNGSPASGSINVPDFAQGDPYFHLRATGNGILPSVSISGTTLSWSYPSSFGAAGGATIVYGVF